MKINFNPTVIVYFAAISVGIYTAILLYFSPNNKMANRLLALLMIAITGWIIDAFLRASGIYGQKPSLYFLPIYYSFAFGPLLYFYVRKVTNKEFVFTRNMLYHFIPVLLQGIFYWCITFQSYQTKYQIWFTIHEPYTYRIEYDGTWLSLVIYLFLSIRYFLKYQHWLADNYSDITKKLLNWLKFSLIMLSLICTAWFFEAVLRDFRNTYYQYDISTNLLSILVYCIGIIGMQQAANNVIFEVEKERVLSGPVMEIDTMVFASIRRAMTEAKLYLNSELTLSDLAKYLQLPAKMVSNNINAATGKPFNTFVNSFRVEEVKLRLKTTDLEKFTLLGIAYDSGFNSKTSFNRIFKEFTGSSPSDFIKK